MRYQGRITSWRDEKGFGFITPNGGGERVFVHINSIGRRRRRPQENALVTYEFALDGKGRAQAKSVAFVGERAVITGASRHSGFPILFSCGFLFLISALVFAGKLSVAVHAVYLVVSLITFLIYAFDKSAASRKEWRTQETTLHLFALLGGWPGALIAQQLLRHKSAKVSFQVTCWVTVALNCAMLGWFLSSYGAEVRHTVLNVI